MIPQAKIQETMLNLLEEYTGCTCVPSSTTKNMPAYPYISFTVINTEQKKGTYAAATDNSGVKVLYMPLLEKWSFTVQSDDYTEAYEKALLISDFFAEARRQELADNDIIVADVGAITPRDNMLTVEYEYRRGLDITLRLNNVITEPDNGVIETVTLTSDKVGDIVLEKE